MTATQPQNPQRRPLRAAEKRMLGLLGVPSFALALGITVVSTYMPVVARGFTRSTLVIGVIVGAEGLMALWLPLIVGSWSDRLRTRWGGRLPFLIASTPLAVLALAGMGFVASVPEMAAVVAIFFVAYFIAYVPYRALYPDAIPNEIAGRAQSTQALWRGAGTGIALLGGGLLLSLGKPVPFLAGAALLAGSITAFVATIARRGIPRPTRPSTNSVRAELADLRDLVAERPALRSFLYANALWELSLGALKTFVVLYLIHGLGFTTRHSSLIVGVTAVFILIAAVFSGRLGDRYGRARVMRFAVPLYGAGLLIPFLVTNHWVLGAALPFVALGGGFMMSLPYALVQPLMPDREHGAVTGYYSLSRGIGTSLGPLLAGLVINQGFGTAHGYSAMWLVCSVSVLLSLPFLGRLDRAETDQRRPPDSQRPAARAYPAARRTAEAAR